jgi:prolyl oligopeptidase PreP (S9A serine peptidase family)
MAGRGNPHQQESFDAIRSYCPYQNVGTGSFPAIIAVAGLQDPRVMYSEPCKWVPKLQEHSTPGRDIRFQVNLESGLFLLPTDTCTSANALSNWIAYLISSGIRLRELPVED